MNKIYKFFVDTRYLIMNRLYVSKSNEQQIKDSFHKLYYNSSKFNGTINNTFYRGVKIYKCPLDLWICQELIYKVKPDYIIECGTAHGGSSLWLRDICNTFGKGKVITIDIKNRVKKEEKGITYIHGSSTDKDVVKEVKGLVKGSKKVMVILDSLHTKDHVFDELKAYSDLINIGSYIIVEDSNIGGNPVPTGIKEGPMEAINKFMRNNKKFVIDKKCEKLLLTFNPNGFLRRIRK